MNYFMTRQEGKLQIIQYIIYENEHEYEKYLTALLYRVSYIICSASNIKKSVILRYMTRVNIGARIKRDNAKYHTGCYRIKDLGQCARVKP